MGPRNYQRPRNLVAIFRGPNQGHTYDKRGMVSSDQELPFERSF